MVAALGINTGYLYGLVFALGGLLAGFAGSLAAPVRSLTPGMGFSVLIKSFIVTVVGGMGSIIGAFVAALAIGLIRAFGSLGLPLFTDGLMYLFMVLILIARPTGLFGKENSLTPGAALARIPSPDRRGGVRNPRAPAGCLAEQR